jgi:hypothetical protein
LPTQSANQDGTASSLQQNAPRQRGFAAITDAIYAYHHTRHAHERHRSKREKVTIAVLSATAIFALIAAIAAGGSAWIFADQLKDAQASRRPWVSAIQVITQSDSLTKINDHFEFPVTVIFKNTGLSLAIQIHAYVRANKGTEDDLRTALNEVCQNVPEDVPTIDRPWLSGFVLAPNQTRNWANKGIENNDIELENLKKNSFWLFGCVKYKDGFNEPHHTRFCFVGRYIGPHIPDEDASLGDCGGGEEAD